MRVGIAYRPEFAGWLKAAPADCLEVAAEAFHNGGVRRLQSIARDHPVILHAHNLSLGGAGALDTRELARFAAMTAAANSMWIVAPLGFSRMAGTDLGFPNPIPLNGTSLSVVAANAAQLIGVCRKRLMVANIAGYLRFPSSIAEPEFLNRLCSRAGCGLCLDLTSLYVSGRNHGFDPSHWLAALDPAYVVQIKVGGCRDADGTWLVTHDCSPCADVLALAEEVCAIAPVEAAVLERHTDFPPVAELARGLDRLQGIAHASAR